MASKSYNSMKQAAVALDIPMAQMKVLKTLCPEGFGKNNSVKGTIVANFYKKNKDLIEKTQKDTGENLKTRKLQNEIILQEIKIEEERRQSINLIHAEEFVANLGLIVCSTLKNKLVKEIPPRVVGLSEEKIAELCKGYYNEFLDIFKKDLKEWLVEKENDKRAKTMLS